jgi:hypothetical protein
MADAQITGARQFPRTGFDKEVNYAGTDRG